MGNSERLVLLPKNRGYCDLDTVLEMIHSLRRYDRKYIRNLMADEYIRYTYGIHNELYESIIDARISMAPKCESFKNPIKRKTIIIIEK